MAGLWLSHLRLSHFRSHKQCALDLDERPVAIYGSNGAGKTSILEAISFLSPGRGLRRATIADIARKPELLGWKVAATLHANDQNHQIETGAEGGNGRTVRLDDKAVPQNALGKTCPVVWLVPNMDRLWVEGAEGRRRFLDRLCLSFIPGHADSALAYEKAMRDRNRLLKDQVSDPSWYGALEMQMAKAGSELHSNRLATTQRLRDAIAQGGSSFPECDLTLRGPDGGEAGALSEQDLTRSLSDNRFKDMAAGRSLTGPHRADLLGIYTRKSLPATECSTGEQKALLLSVVLAHARALKQDFGAAPLLLLDEVAAHLDTDRCKSLFSELKELGAQAWMTGTGPELFTAWGNDAQRVLVSEKDGLSFTEFGQTV